MHIEISFGDKDKKKDGSVIDPSLDPNKFLEIKEKLCAKRRTLETELAEHQNEESLSNLNFHKESMKAFGITEVDYIAYLEKQKEVK